MPKTVFISHASPDKPAVEALANALRARGHAVWLDKYELSPQQSFVRQINDGLERADAGIVVFSEHTKQSAWVQAELDALLYAYIQERQPLIPVKLAEDAPIPPLLRPLLYRRIDEHEAISDALDNRKPVPQDVDAQAARTDRVRIRLDKTEDDRIAVAVTFNDAPEPFVETAYDALPAAIVQGREGFLRDFRAGLRRDADTARRSAMTRTLHALGEALRDFCLPGGARAALAAMLSATRVGDTVEVWFEAADAELLGLPLEALRLGDGRVLAVVPEVVVLRRVTDLAPLDFTPLPGPLKILVAVGAPDEGLSTAAVLDHERELQNILNATEQAHRSDTAQVRILEVGHPQAISEALERDDYHVLHLSCHGNAGVLLLETEDGEEMKVKPADLLEPIRGEGRTLPLVVLNACHGGVPDAQTGSFAHALLDAGVPCVLAMQTSVSDYYATELAAAFYRVLYRREHQRPSRALAKARKALEAARQKALQTEAPLHQTQPEYATPTLFVRDEAEPRLANFGPHREPLSTPPVYALAGPVPQLSRDAFIGRRKPLRQALRTIRTDTAKAGVLLTGIGGVGKSALAGRAMRRLVESGYVPVAHKGVWDLGAIATSVGTELMQMSDEALQKKGTLLFQPELPDTARLTLLQQVLATVPLLLVLDDFEQNLTAGGAAFRDGAVADYLQMLAHNARTSRLLLTCRYPLPATDLAAYFETVPLGPLSDAEARKLMRRLPAFEDLDPKEWARILRLVGGHPRMLEFVDALLNRGKGRLPEVENKLREILEEQGVSADAAVADVDAAIQQAILVGARDVLLEQLVDLAGAADAREALLQLAVSNLPVSPAGLAHMLADAEPTEAQVDTARAALDHLTTLSLAYRTGPEDAGADRDAAVHRWTAEGLARRSDEAELHTRSSRAGRYRMWRVKHDSKSIVDGMEAVRNFLAGQSYDDASREAIGIIQFFQRNNQTTMIALVAGEVLETLPAEQGDYGFLLDQEARAYLALGFSERAFEQYGRLLRLFQQRVTDYPDRADYQRDLSVSYNKVGDLYRALGQGEQARDAYQRSLDIAERLAKAEPDRADYQRDLSVSYTRLAQHHLSLDEPQEAFGYFVKDLQIAERLAQAEPGRADYQVDLAISLMQVAPFTDKRTELLTSALQILTTLQAEGRLDPSRAGMIERIQALLEGG